MAKIEVKNKIKPKIRETEDEAQRVEDKVKIKKLARRYIKLEKELAKFSELQKKQNEIAKQLKEHADNTRKDNQELVIRTKLGTVKLGKKGMTSSIKDMKLLRNMIGKEAWRKLATISITDARKYLNPEQLKRVIDEKQNGARRLTIE